MKHKLYGLLLLPVVFACPTRISAQELNPMELPQPITDGGKPLMQALKARHTTREFQSDPLRPQVLSSLLRIMSH